MILELQGRMLKRRNINKLLDQYASDKGLTVTKKESLHTVALV